MILKNSELAGFSKLHSSNGRRIVFTTGTFDLLHAGQGRYLAEAKCAGDVLVVGVEKSLSYLKRKGSRPLLKESIRADLLTYLRSVDAVVLVDEASLEPIFKKLQPDVFYTLKGGKSHTENIGDTSYNIIKSEPYEPYLSTSKLVQMVAERQLLSILSRKLASFGDCLNLTPAGPIKMTAQMPRNLLGLNYKGEIWEVGELAKRGEKLRQLGKKIVFTAGSFDLIHVGHARYLDKARSQGDFLVVGLPSNSSIRRLKGSDRPLLDEGVRAETLTYFRGVDAVVIFDDDTVLNCLKALKPDVFFTVDESWNSGLKKSSEYQTVVKNGGQVILAPRQAPTLSASLIINKAAGDRVKEVFKECLIAVVS